MGSYLIEKPNNGVSLDFKDDNSFGIRYMLYRGSKSIGLYLYLKEIPNLTYMGRQNEK